MAWNRVVVVETDTSELLWFEFLQKGFTSSLLLRF